MIDEEARILLSDIYADVMIMEISGTIFDRLFLIFVYDYIE